MKKSRYIVALMALWLLAAPAVAEQDAGWTGFYGGVQTGRIDADGANALADVSADSGMAGVHAGYNRDFGGWVLGAEVDFDAAGTELTRNGASLGELNSVSRLKLRAGYGLGQTLFYATAGPAKADTDLGDDTGEFYGVGIAYEISNQFVMSGEILSHDFGDIGGTSSNEVGADTLTVRFSLRF
ncbi:MAG: outer membrane protein [Roseobacter sp.]